MRIILLIFSFFLYSCSFHALANCISIGKNDDAQICVKDGKIFSKSVAGDVTISPDLGNTLHGLQSWLSIKNDFSDYESVVYIEVASKPESHGIGYCGAGHEGYLLLLDHRNKQIGMIDKKLIDSCLKSISLTSDQGDDPHSAFNVLPGNNEVMSYKVIDNGTIKTKVVRIDNNKLSINPLVD